MTFRLGKRFPSSYSGTSLELLLLAALACTEADAPLATRSYIDEGALCLSPRGAGGAHVQVLFDTCASLCDEVVAASCEASVTGGVILVASEASTESAGDVVCPAGCRQLDAACTLPELPDGYYELRYGSRVATVSMPVPIAGSLVSFDSEPAPKGDPCESLPLLP